MNAYDKLVLRAKDIVVKVHGFQVLNYTSKIWWLLVNAELQNLLKIEEQQAMRVKSSKMSSPRRSHKAVEVDYDIAEYTVQDEVHSNTVYFTGSYEECKTFIGNQPDWEKYGIVSPVSGRFVSFILSRYI
jgi:hypothetical protein